MRDKSGAIRHSALQSAHPDLATRMRTRRWLAVLVAVVLIPVVMPETGYADGPRPFGIPCRETDFVRFCEGGPGWFSDRRVHSFDAVPLDVDVTLPKEGSGPWPILFMLHGWGNDKTAFEASDPKGKTPAPFFAPGYNTVTWAERGYAVVTYTARGQIDSCGSLLGSLLEGNGLGTLRCPGDAYTRFADLRYELRDTQFLAGRLVDDGIGLPKVAATGASYGAGQSLMLATLRDRTMLPGGRLVPWESPNGTPMEITAAAPFAPWSDIVETFVPNGRTIVGEVQDLQSTREPVGVERSSMTDVLFLGGAAAMTYSEPGTNPQADIIEWFDEIDEGEPYRAAEIDPILEMLQDFHSPVGIMGEVEPAPVFMISGWTDDLFPPQQTLRYYYNTLAEFPDTPMQLRYASVGHWRAQNKLSIRQSISHDAMAWIDHYTTGRSDPSDVPVRSWGQTCPDSAPSDGPYDADSYDALAPGMVTFEETGKQLVDTSGGRSELSWAIDPAPLVADFHLPWPGVPDWASGLAVALGAMAPEALNLMGIACRETTTAQDAGVAVYELPPGDYTLVGVPTIEADVEVRDAAPAGELAGRIWDVDESAGTQLLVTKGVYRLDDNQNGRITFQLDGNTWKLRPGHHLKLELLGSDFNSWRPSNNKDFTVEISELSLTLPTRQAGDQTVGPA